MRFFVAGLVIFCSVSILSAANNNNNGRITGTVIDSLTHEPLSYVTVFVKKTGSSDAITKGTTTDIEGNFILENIPFDNYILTASFIGYDLFEKEVSLSASFNIVDVERIALKESTQSLGEVVVEGLRSQMRMEIDKRVFNVDQNISSTGGSANDILTNIPSVEVDSEGSISLRGNTSVTVWINGKASGLTAENRSQVLSQLPAENIDKVEVITNPSARYSPEGTAGIINIVLKKNRKAGYYGSAQIGANTLGGYNTGFNYNYSSSKLDAYAGLSYSKYKRRGGGYNNRSNISDTDTTYLNQTSDNNGYSNFFWGNAGATYHLTPKDHFTVGGYIMFGGGKSTNDINYLSNVTNSFLNSRRAQTGDNDMPGENIELGYKHEFNNSHYIDFTAAYNVWNWYSTSVYNQHSVFENHTESSYQRQKNDEKNNYWDIRLDYQNAFNENHKIEAGYNGVLSRDDSPVETFSGLTKDDATLDTNLFNRFLYDNDIHAIYGTYSGRLNKFGFQVGLRGEYSHRSTRSLEYNQMQSDVSPSENDLFSLFPSAFLSYSLPKDNEVQISYTRRISRPWGSRLNGFINITDPNNISYGNPELNPEYSNAFELNYIKTWSQHLFSLSAYYRTTNDVIQRISFLDGNVMKSTYENVTQSTSSGTEFILKNQLFKSFDLTTTVNLFYYQLSGFAYTLEGSTIPIVGESNDNFSWNTRIITNLKLPKSYNLQITGNYSAKQVVAQGYRKANYSLDAGLRKSFGKISFSISARDILDSRKWTTITSGQGFRQENNFWGGGRQFSFTLTYNFGNMNSKQNNRLQNDVPTDRFEMEMGR
ncbi:MAG: TonB-dependent receptor [Tannerellaceae bacterium]|jgi:outer membrane receptor protein involved in Fe transport|nr:TonB-dependent receptor [Tannerellaceae bacterium]